MSATKLYVYEAAVDKPAHLAIEVASPEAAVCVIKEMIEDSLLRDDDRPLYWGLKIVTSRGKSFEWVSPYGDTIMDMLTETEDD